VGKEKKKRKEFTFRVTPKKRKREACAPSFPSRSKGKKRRQRLMSSIPSRKEEKKKKEDWIGEAPRRFRETRGKKKRGKKEDIAGVLYK